jgi:hypothetical protein
VLEPHDQGTKALTLEPTPALLEVDEALDEVEQYAIQIRRRDLPDTVDVFGSQVVAVIELVSPANKGLTGTADRRKFLAKRRDYLASLVSYMEIDLGAARDIKNPIGEAGLARKGDLLRPLDS